MSEGAAAFTFGDAARVAAPSAATNATILGRIKATSVASVAAQVSTFPVEARDGFSASFGRYLPREQWDLFRTVHGEDRDRFAKAVLLAQNRGIEVDGDPWLGAERIPLTLKDPELWAAFDVADGFAAIKALFIYDASVWRAADAVLRAAGWDLSTTLDPIRRSGAG